MAGIHLVPPLAGPDPATAADLAEAERETLASLQRTAESDSGYSREHATRPQTIGYALIFPAELQRPSQRWAQRRFPDIRYWGEPARGGHFAAFEQPELFVNEICSFFRLIR